MTPSWERIQGLFLEALDLPPDERASFLDVACGGDQDVRREVESLIAHDSSGEQLIAEALQETAQSLLGSENVAGVRLGSWRVLREIGRGGMGTVYLACRDDDQFRKHVAIKVVAHGVDTAEMLNRFRHERQILAHLDHPYIARLIDGGNTPQGKPFLVMEYVEGRPIDAYCSERKLDVAGQLRLFLKVCDAVSYAHRNLTIHRDLKPGNILVTSDGSPRLLDFGIAKVLDEISVGSAEHATRVLTPEYGSPEQARGEAVTTATDVYSLGGVLYKLLTGVAPHPILDTSPLAIMRAIKEDVRKPSDLRQGLSTDLDSILLKALHPEPQRRYRSVDEFAGDIERLLEGRPVTARPDTIWYRAGKYVRRHVLATSMSAAIVVLLAGFAALQSIQLRKTQSERDRANRITDFMTKMFKVSDPSEARGNSVTAREILDKASSGIESGLAKDPVAQAQMMHVMGVVYYGLGLFHQADTLMSRAVEIRRRVWGPENPDTLQSMNELVYILGMEDRYSEQEKLARHVLDARRRILGPQHQDTLASMLRLSACLNQGGHYDESIKLAREVFETRRRVLGPSHPDTLNAMQYLSRSLEDAGQYPEAEKMGRELLDLRRSGQGINFPATVVAESNLGWILYREGRYPEADGFLREAVDTGRRVYGPGHPTEVGLTGRLAINLAAEGRDDEAEKLEREALEIFRGVSGPESYGALVTEQNLAATLEDEGQYAEAEKLLRSMVETGRRALGPEQPEVLRSMGALGRTLGKEGHLGEAEKMERETIETLRRTVGPKHPATLQTETYLAETLNLEGQNAHAETVARQTLEVQLPVVGRWAPETLDTLQALGIAMARQHRYAEAKNLFDDMIGQQATAVKPSLGRAWYAYACVAAAANDLEAAVQHMRDAVANGYQNAAHARVDDDLKSLRGDVRFKALLASMHKSAMPAGPATPTAAAAHPAASNSH